MRIAVCLLAAMLAVPLVPLSAQAQSPEDLVPSGEGPALSPEEELARRLHDLFGLPPVEIQTNGFCKPGAGCFPVYVDEAGDTMQGVLRMLDDIVVEGAGIELTGAGSSASDQMDPLGAGKNSFISHDLALLNMPVELTQQLRLLQGAFLNATGGGVVFIDHSGNLTFADGSWFNAGGASWNSNATFNENVFIQGEGKNLYVNDGAALVLDNTSGLVTKNGAGRIGTLDFNPFHLIANNTTVLLLVPGSTPNLVGGHATNSAANGTIGVIIAGGGAEGLHHNATADFTAILGGLNNTAGGAYAVVLGGRHNDAAGLGSLAAGQRARALHNGTFVWADGQPGDFVSTGADQFLVRAQGGLGVNTDTPQSALTVGGNITPAADDTYALGSPTHRWNQLYMASEIDYATDLLYNSGGANRATLTTSGDFLIGGRFIGDGSQLTGVVASELSNASVTAEKIAPAAVTSPAIASGSVGSGHLATGAVGTSHLQDGSVTSQKLADGAVTSDKLGIFCTEQEILKSLGGAWVCALDEGVSTLDWSALTGKPAGFADDIDDDTTYAAGNGLFQAGNTFNVDTTTIQSRVAACGPGSSIRAIAENGTVTCEPDTDTDTDTTYTAGDGLVLSGTIFSLLGCQPGEILKINGNGTWACAPDADGGGDITGVTAGDGLTGGGATGDVGLAVDTTTIQKRVLGTCDDDETMGGIGADGSVVCHIDDDTTYTNGPGLDLFGNAFSVNASQVQSRVTATCAPGFSIRAIAADGSVLCEEDTDTDTDTDTTYTAGPGLALAGTEFSADDTYLQRRVATGCDPGFSIRAIAADGSVLCEEDTDTDTDTDTTYTAGPGLALAGTEFIADDTYLQRRVATGCGPGFSIRVIAADGTVLCEEDTDTDTDTTYTADTGLDLAGTTFSVNATQVQSRIASTCAPGSSIRVVAEDGTVTCEADTDTDTTYSASGPLTLDGTVFGLLPCAEGQLLRFSGAWGCDEETATTSLDWSAVTNKPAGFADDVDDDTTYTAGAGLDLAGTTFAVDTTEVQSRVTGSCAMFDSLAGASIVSIGADGSVNCAADDDTTYTAGFGLALAGTSFSADLDEVQHRVSSSCAAGSAIQAIDAAGAVTCATMTDAETLDGLDAAQFLRSDINTTFDGTIFTIPTGSNLHLDGTLSSDLVPSGNGTQMLGNNTHRFSDLWLASVIHFMDELSFYDSEGQLAMALNGNGDITTNGGVFASSLNGNGTGIGGVDAITLDGVDGTQFLRSDVDAVKQGDLRLDAGALGINSLPSETWTVDAKALVQASGSQSAAIRGTGAFGPTNGYLGVQGAADFDGVLTADWSGREIGVAGISDGASQTDNYGVLGHASHVGVRGEHKTSPAFDYGELGASGVGVRARGTTLAGEFLGDVAVGRDSSLDDDFVYFDTGTTEWLKWDESAGRFEFSDDLSVDTRLYLAEKLLEAVGDELRFAGRTVCTTAGECPGTSVIPAAGVGPLDPDTDKDLTLSAGAAVCWIDVDSSNHWNTGDWLILDVDDKSCSGGSAEAGDMRLTTTAYGAAFSRIASGDGETVNYAGQLLQGSNGTGTTGLMGGTINTAFVYYDADGNGVPNARHDDVYADVDRSGAVSAGDYRWTSDGSGFGSGTVVAANDLDIGRSLTLIAGITDALRYWDLTASGAPDLHDPLYLSMMGGLEVEYGDVRLSDLSTL